MACVEYDAKATLEKRLRYNSRELTRNTCVMDAAILEEQTETELSWLPFNINKMNNYEYFFILKNHKILYCNYMIHNKLKKKQIIFTFM